MTNETNQNQYDNLIDDDERSLEDIIENGNVKEALEENSAYWERMQFKRRFETPKD